MAAPFPRPPAPSAAALKGRLRAPGRALELLSPGRSASDPGMPARLPESIVRPMDRVGSDPPGCGSGEARKNGARTGITERNGIWVLTIGGVWHGDYRKRAQAEAEAARMQQARR